MARVLHLLLNVPGDILLGIISSWPGPSGRVVRRLYWGQRLRHIGRGVVIDEGVVIDHPEWVSIGSRTWIDRGVILIGGPPREGREQRERPNPDFQGLAGELLIGEACHIGAYVVISAMGGVRIGDGVTVSVGSRIYSLSHHYRSFERPTDPSIGFGSMIPDDRQVLVSGPVTMENDSAVGADCLVLPGAHLGHSAFVLPRSIVRGRIAPGRIASGSPAEEIGDRYASTPVA